jgi:hypothetical protein
MPDFDIAVEECPEYTEYEAMIDYYLGLEP